jgi:hypothetical protein
MPAHSCGGPFRLSGVARASCSMSQLPGNRLVPAGDAAVAAIDAAESW